MAIKAITRDLYNYLKEVRVVPERKSNRSFQGDKHHAVMTSNTYSRVVSRHRNVGLLHLLQNHHLANILTRGVKLHPELDRNIRPEWGCKIHPEFTILIELKIEQPIGTYAARHSFSAVFKT